MSFCGIICEFNPFHNGHKYLIEKAKEITGSDIICLMSGDFVQRGEPAIQNKYTRAINAINNGASAVLELPTIYSCTNAENFAKGAIKILNALGVSQIAFGVEETTLETLQKIAEIKYKNSTKLKNLFKEEFQNGQNYSCALKLAIQKYLGDEKIKMQILDKPNNILAIEYLTALLKTKSKIKPIAIKRCDNGYNSEKTNGNFLSATGIRNKITNDEDYKVFVPKNAINGIIFDKNAIKSLETLQFLKIKLTPAEKLNIFYDYNEGIEYRIKKFFLNNNIAPTIDIKEQLSTRRYRKARINKLFLYPLLGITKTIIKSSYKTKPATKLIAIKKDNKEFLKSYDKQKINVIVCNKDYNLLSNAQQKIIDIDLVASEIYQTLTSDINYIDKKNGTLFI